MSLSTPHLHQWQTRWQCEHTDRRCHIQVCLICHDQKVEIDRWAADPDEATA